jgi:glucose-6-phosphate dehydrogenase assembly protein OpcA
MIESATDAFLSGQGLAVEPGRVEAELSRLWGPAAERVGGPVVDNPHVTRVVLTNLVVEAEEATAAVTFATLDAVIARFPSRAIVLGRTPADGEARSVKAEIAALCHLPAPGLPQVCSERIILRAGPASLDLLPGAVRPLLESDLPVVLWWTGDPSGAEGLFRTLAREATRLVLDLPDPGASPEALRLGLDTEVNAYSRDSAWFGIGRWRELIAQCFDGSGGREAIGRLASVRVEAIAPGSGAIPRRAVWLAAWLAGSLGWTAVRRENGPGRIDAVFRAGDREVSVSIRAAVDSTIGDAQIRSVALELVPGDGPSSFRLARPERCPERIRVEVCSDRACALPRVVVAPDLDAPRRIAAALESSRDDPPFRKALPHALWLLGA